VPRNPDTVWVDPDEEDALLSASMRRREQFARARGGITPEMAQRAQSLLLRHSNLSAGLMQALAQAPQVPDSVADQLAEEDDGGLFDRVRDIGGDVLGDITREITSGTADALSGLHEQAIKPALRGAFTIAEGLSEELVKRPLTAGLAYATGEAPSLASAYGDYGDSALVNIGETGFDLGTGFFAGGEAKALSNRERTLTINDQRANVGQGFAAALVGGFQEPGDRLYDAVAGISGFAVDVGLDPTAALTGGATTALRARSVLSAGDAAGVLRQAGAIAGERRNTVLIEKARDFFGNKALLDRLAKADEYTIFQSWSKSPANRIDMETIGRLGRTQEPAEIAEILFESVARGDITRRGIVTGPSRFVRDVAAKTPVLKSFTSEGKLAGISPNGFISADDLDTAAQKVDSLLRQSNIGHDERAQIFSRMAAVETGRFDQLFDVTTDALDLVARQVGDPSISSLKDVAKGYADELEAFRQYGVDSVGGAIPLPYAKTKVVQNFDGEMIETIIPTPQITSELNSLALHLPEVTDIRRAATKNRVLRSVYTSKGWDITADSTRWLTQTVFKPAALLRPAYVVRIGLEEQARLTAAHHDSIFSHPFRYLMANVVNRKALTDLDGNDLTSVARSLDVVTKDAHGVLADRMRSRARVFGQVSVSVDDAGNLTEASYRGWRGELGQIAAAPEARKMAELRGNQEAFKAWAQTEGRESIERLAKINDDAKRLLDFGDSFDAWADGLSRRIHAKTGWDDEIIAKVVNQEIPFAAPGKAARNADANFQRFLSSRYREVGGPGKVKLEHVPDHHTKTLDSALGVAFDYITGKPTSYLARFPAFRQTMIRRGAELMDGLADDALRAQAFDAFSTSLKLTKAEARNLKGAVQAASGKQGVIDNIDDLNQILVTKSAEDVKHLLFDVTRRGAAQEAAVVIVPFLDAWKEVTKTWMRLTKENPAFFIRAQAGYRSLKENGTFYVNQFGEEVFRYPGGGALSTFVDEMNERGGGLENIPMAAAAATGRVISGDTPEFSVAPEGSIKGLNMIATGVGPGFGPVVQWGATMFSTPDTEKLRQFIAPFGTGAMDDPEDLLNFGGIVGGITPAWLRKMLNAVSEGGIDPKQWNSTVGDAMAALAASGRYDPADSDRLREDAERYATYLLMFRGATQATGPTGPNMSVQVEADADTEHADWNPEMDPSGRMFFLSSLRDHYHDLAETYGHDQAAAKFFDLYGMEPFQVTQVKSTTLGRALPVDAEGDKWMAKNADVVETHPLVAGFFAPSDEKAELDMSVYSAQFQRGDRRSLTPEEQQRMAIQFRARAIWNNVVEQTEPLPSKQKAIAREQAKAQLERLHPGWSIDILPMPAVADKINELQRAVTDSRLADNPLTEPLSQYLQLREAALMSVRARSGSPNATFNREDAAKHRRLLNQFGTALSQQNTAFLGVWSSVLKKELQED
jgi:hypothetical protein